MHVTNRLCTDPSEWDKFVSCVPWATGQHAFGYGQSLASSFNFLQPCYQVFLRDGLVVAGLPLFLFSVGKFFRALYSLPFRMHGGPLIDSDHIRDEDLLQEISKYIEDEAAHQRVFETSFYIPPQAPDSVHKFMQFSYQNSTHYKCLLLPLDRPWNDVVSGYRPAVRRAIAKSRLKSVKVLENPDTREVYRTYPLYVASMRKFRATAKPWRFIRSLLRQGICKSFVAKWHERYVGVIFLIINQNYAFYWLSGWDPSASKVRPMNALLDAAIHWCHERGISSFSFGEASSTRPGYERFCKAWGTVPVQATFVVQTYHRWTQRIWYALEPSARRIYQAIDTFIPEKRIIYPTNGQLDV